MEEIRPMSKKKSKRRIETDGMVYSTDSNYDFSVEEEAAETLPPQQQDLRILLRRLKGGKIATVITKFRGAEEDLKDLGKQLKSKCGTGGSVKDGEIIIQGNMREKVGQELGKMGYRYKNAGG